VRLGVLALLWVVVAASVATATCGWTKDDEVREALLHVLTDLLMVDQSQYGEHNVPATKETTEAGSEDQDGPILHMEDSPPLR
jgi:hypothetical protein